MTDKPIIYSAGGVLPRILTMRGQKVVLDSDLAAIYGVETSRFNEAIKRNRSRFPKDFAFQIERKELTDLISQNAISSSGHGGRRKLPWVFTEHGDERQRQIPAIHPRRAAGAEGFFQNPRAARPEAQRRKRIRGRRDRRIHV